MKKEMFKTKFRAIMNVGGKVFTFAKSADTEQGVLNLVKAEGFSLASIAMIESFQMSTEKRRGKTARKY